jgi:membrane fusion protein, multidrug efflux system
MRAAVVLRAPAAALTGPVGDWYAGHNAKPLGGPERGHSPLPGPRLTSDMTTEPHGGGTPVKKMMLIVVVVTAMVAAGCGSKEKAAPPPPEVYVAEVVQKDVPVPMELVGQTRGAQDVEIRARVEGFLDRVAFAEGSFVSRGALLYQIDPKDLQAAFARAQADLATAQARLAKTENDVKRLTPLAAQQAVSQQELDNSLAFRDAAKAQVEAGQAVVERARIDLGYATITSPIDGLVGTTMVKPGSLVGRGESTLLTTVSQIDPILFRAGISEAGYLDIARRAEEIRRGSSSEKIPIELILADGTVHLHTGQLDAVERAIDPTTGTLSLQFTFPNPERLVRPGQYGRARFVVEVKKGALLVPQRAVQELQNLRTVAVVGADDTISIRTVKVGPRFESLWVIEEGLNPGDRVVVEGLQRVREGVKVTPKPVANAATEAR